MKKYIIISILSIICKIGYGQEVTILDKIEEITKDKRVEIGVSIHDFSTNTTVTLEGDRRFPMQSILKLPVGIAALNKVDKGEFKLTQYTDITKEKLHLNTWSPIQKEHPGGASLTLLQLLDYTIAKSDNNGCDIIIDMLGGAQCINDYFKDIGIDSINIEVNELELNSQWSNMYRNWITPNGAINLLKQIHKKEILSSAMHHELWQIMTNSKTGSFRKKLPESVLVGNKTGSSGYKDGVSIATNDIGIIILPNGKAIAFAIFLTNSHEVSEVNYDIISDIAEAIFEEYFMNI